MKHCGTSPRVKASAREQMLELVLPAIDEPSRSIPSHQPGEP